MGHGQAAKEAKWLPRLAPHLPLALPVPVAMGHPAEGYPFDWSVYEWLPGQNANGTIDDLDLAAVDLAAFVIALRRIDTTGAHPRPPHGRGAPLAENDESGTAIDRPARRPHRRRCRPSLVAAVSRCAGRGTARRSGCTATCCRATSSSSTVASPAVIDFGGLNVGDPACDLQPAWNVFAGDSRARFRAELDVDDASWLRGRGWALCQAVSALPYYWDTNPGMVRQASHALAQVLGDG